MALEGTQVQRPMTGVTTPSTNGTSAAAQRPRTTGYPRPVVVPSMEMVIMSGRGDNKKVQKFHAGKKGKRKSRMIETDRKHLAELDNKIKQGLEEMHGLEQ